MPRTSRHWEIEKEQDGAFKAVLKRYDKENRKWIVEKEIKGDENILRELFKCPLCGRKATIFVVRKWKYKTHLYLVHYNPKYAGGNQKKHQWFLQEWTPEAQEFLEKVFKQRREIEVAVRRILAGWGTPEDYEKAKLLFTL